VSDCRGARALAGYCGSSTTAVAASVFVLGGSTHAGNRAVGRGGAVFVGNGCNFTASGRFLGNSAGSGGARRMLCTSGWRSLAPDSPARITQPGC